MEAAAKAAGAIVNSVMLGAIAGSGRLPIPSEAFEAAIKRDGKAVESNLRGFRAGLAASRAKRPVPLARSGKRGAKPTLAALEAEAAALPEAARAFATEGVRRLVAYQNADYARLYLDRLKAIAEPKLLAETARHLAVRMSYEDVIRVAEAKIDPARFRRIEGEIGAKDQPYVITEFLKPGIEELCQVLPPRLARAIVSYSEKRGWLGTVYFGMELKTTTVWGYLRFWALAKLHRFRPKSWRYAEEQILIEAWLARVVAAAKLSRRSRARSRRMRAPDQGLRRHLEARLLELPDHRGARHCARARRPHRRRAGHRRDCVRPHRRAARSRRRGARQGTRRDRRAGGDAARGGVVRFLPLSRLRERVPNRAAVRRERVLCITTRSPLPAAVASLRRPPSPQAGEGKGHRARRYFLSTTAFNCASPRSKSGPSIASMLITRHIALAMKLCLPLMVQITSV